jgi:hypothetical protein
MVPDLTATKTDPEWLCQPTVPPGATVTCWPARSEASLALALIGSAIVDRTRSVPVTPVGGVAPAALTQRAEATMARIPARRVFMIASPF